jgi:hypothetical protein
MLAWVKWERHLRSPAYRGSVEDAPDHVVHLSGKGALIGFTNDHDNQPCGVVVEQIVVPPASSIKRAIEDPVQQFGGLKTIRLSEIVFDRWS